MSIENVLYRANARATGGRDGRAITDDGRLDVRLTTPPGTEEAGPGPTPSVTAPVTAPVSSTAP